MDSYNLNYIHVNVMRNNCFSSLQR